MFDTAMKALESYFKHEKERALKYKTIYEEQSEEAKLQFWACIALTLKEDDLMKSFLSDDELFNVSLEDDRDDN